MDLNKQNLELGPGKHKANLESLTAAYLVKNKRLFYISSSFFLYKSSKLTELWEHRLSIYVWTEPKEFNPIDFLRVYTRVIKKILPKSHHKSWSQNTSNWGKEEDEE